MPSRRLTLNLTLAIFSLSLSLSTLLISTPAIAAPPQGFQNEELIQNLDQPVAFDFAADGRMFILLRSGDLLVVQSGATTPDTEPVITFTNTNTTTVEQGLLGFALDPDFEQNNYFYIFYTRQTPHRDTVSRFVMNGNTAEESSEIVLWSDNVDSGEWHHGGQIAFGNDGKIYISTGDHHDTNFTSAHVSQILTSYRGKILRINKDGSIPTDNPFYDGAGPNLDEIWARGLRNPFRFSIDSQTGRIFIADVGGNDNATAYEEVNIGVAGANYGWPLCEGTCSLPGITSPVFTYPHSGRDASITGGFVYRSEVYPSEFNNNYYYADYTQNWVKRIPLDENGNIPSGAVSVPFEPFDGTPDGPYGDIVDLKQGTDGYLYYADIGISWDGQTQGLGSINRIKFTPTSNQAPIINSVSADTTSGPGPELTVNFTSDAIDPEGLNLEYNWNFADGSTSDQANPSHTFTQKGSYSVRLSVSDGVNTTLSENLIIEVGEKPTAQIDSPTHGSNFIAGETISFSGSGADTDGTISEENFSWTILFKHEEHVHPFLGPIVGTSSSEFTVPNTGHSFSGDTGFQITLTITDSDGLKTSKSIIINPDKVNINYQTSPTGLQLSTGQETMTTPFSIDTLKGFKTSINATAQQGLGGKTYKFLYWSDWGAAQHEITAPTDSQFATQYTANYIEEKAYPNGSLFFDGNDAVYGPNFPLFTVFTIEAWVKKTLDNDKDQVILSDGNADYTQAMYTLVIDGGSSHCPQDGEFAYHQIGDSQQCSGIVAELGEWHHVAVSRDIMGTRRIFVDGVLANTRMLTPAPQDSTGNITVGSAGISQASYFNGYIDEVRISSSAAYINNFNPPTSTLQWTPTTQLLWHFNEGSGEYTGDYSGRKRPGQLGILGTVDASNPLWVPDTPLTN